MTDMEWLDAAAGRKPVDLLIKKARWLDVFSGTFREGDLGVHKGLFTGPGSYRARRILDLEGRYLVPGFIEAHCHLESTMLTPREFARAVLPRGTTAVVADPHEIANVMGLEGIRYLVEASRGLPVKFFFTLPSCVPATHLETSGAKLSAAELALLAQEPWVAGLGEVMNAPGVVLGDRQVHEKLDLFRARVVDGHAPAWTGKLLNAYVGCGILSDHECTSLEEAQEKLSLGMWIMIREGSTAKNLEALLPLVNQSTVGRCLLVSDDRTPEHLMKEGHLDGILRQAAGMGMDPVLALQMVTINPSRYFGFRNMGGIAPGYAADAVVLDSLKEFEISMVISGGRLVWGSKGGLRGFGETPSPSACSSWRMAPVSLERLKVRASGDRMRVMGVVPGQLFTRQAWFKPKVKDGLAVSDPSRDILKLVVAERHRATGNLGIGFVRGFGLKEGALASSVAHDSHNLVVVGVEDRDILAALKEVASMEGGLVVIKQGRVLERLPLPVAGLISPWPLERVVRRHEKLLGAAMQLGCALADPFMVLSFLALPVIPELKLTDLGLVDVKGFKKVGLFKE
jgi:adenine deaminase